jgi:hypothetical protein
MQIAQINRPIETRQVPSHQYYCGRLLRTEKVPSRRVAVFVVEGTGGGEAGRREGGGREERDAAGD